MNNYVNLWDELSKCIYTPKEKESTPDTSDTYELHITCRDGKTTHAVYKKNGQIVDRTKALCNPDDKFSFIAGALVALSRLDACTEERPVWTNLMLDKKEEPAKPTEPSEPLWAHVKEGDKVMFKRHPGSIWNDDMYETEDEVFTVAKIAHRNSGSHGILYVLENPWCYLVDDVVKIL